MNVYAEALSQIPRGEHDQHIEADSDHALISQVAQGATLLEVYSCKIWATKALDI